MKRRGGGDGEEAGVGHAGTHQGDADGQALGAEADRDADIAGGRRDRDETDDDTRGGADRRRLARADEIEDGPHEQGAHRRQKEIGRAHV